MTNEKIIMGTQRNTSDIALELTKMWYKTNTIESVEELKSTYKQFYKAALEAKSGK